MRKQRRKELWTKRQTMRKLILEEWISMDGFVTDQAGTLDFFSRLTPDRNTYSDSEQLRFLDRIDTILLGRKTYELFVEFWPTATTGQEAIADRMNELKKMVFSQTLSGAPWGSWPEALLHRGEAAEAIREWKAQEGKDMVLWGSISLAQTLLKEDLIDELHLQLCPVCTGGGRRLFPEGQPSQDWQLQEARTYPTGAVFLNYLRAPDRS